MPIEFEYKYLVEKVPDQFVNRLSHCCIEQFYITNDTKTFMSTRAREKWYSGNNEPTHWVTHKIGSGPSVMETEYQIDKKHYQELKKHFKIGNIIKKTRAVIRIDSREWDVDIFENGMVVAELEKPPYYLKVPKVFGRHRNVTKDEIFKNVYMAMWGLPTREYLETLL